MRWWLLPVLLVFAALAASAAEDDNPWKMPGEGGRNPKEAPARRAPAAAKSRERAPRYLTVEHPRILVTRERLAFIRAQIAEPDSQYRRVHDLMRGRVLAESKAAIEVGYLRTVNDTSSKLDRYGASYLAREAGFLCQLAEDPAERKRYADVAFHALPDLQRFKQINFKSTTLAHAMGTLGFALAYDWCHDEWDDAQRRKVEEVLDYLREHWATSDWKDHRAKVADPQADLGYNFFGVIYGAEILLHLATGGEKDERFATCLEVLRRHLDAYSSLGTSPEGIGYTEYPMEFAIPAALAADRCGFPAPLAAARRHEFWRLSLYVHNFTGTFDRKFVPYGVSHRSNINSGWATFQFALAPTEQLPHVLWWYDRHMGRLAGAAEKRLCYDSERGNAFYFLLFHPDGVAARDPTGALPPAIADPENGYWFFRNRWRDHNDIQVAAMADLARSHGWDQDEQLGLRLLAYDTSFVGGTGKERGPEVYSTLLVDGTRRPVFPKGAPAEEAKRHRPGELLAWEPDGRGGYLVLGGGDFYRAMGVKSACRHLLVRFGDVDENTAMISTLDDVTSEAEHRYTWQAALGAEGMIVPAALPAPPKDEGANCTPSPVDTPLTKRHPGEGNPLPDLPEEMIGEPPPAKGKGTPEPKPPVPDTDGVVTEASTEAGRPCFLWRGSNGWVKGWVLHPADATITIGDPFRIETAGKDAKLWVVLRVGRGDPPTATVAGKGMASVLTVADRTVRYDAAADRVRCE